MPKPKLTGGEGNQNIFFSLFSSPKQGEMFPSFWFVYYKDMATWPHNPTLSTCSHSGMITKGLELFEKMVDYGVTISEKHYACVVDLLGRAGLLDQAVELIRSMPMEAGKDEYGALLGACRIHNNIELAKEAAEKLFVLDPENAGRYILLVIIYEDVGRWEDAGRVRKLLRHNNVKKPTGSSSVEVDCMYHTFGADDKSHRYTDQIFNTLQRLDTIMEEETVTV